LACAQQSKTIEAKELKFLSEDDYYSGFSQKNENSFF